MYVCQYSHTHTVPIYIYTYIHIIIIQHTYIYIHTYTYIYTYTYIHTHIYIIIFYICMHRHIIYYISHCTILYIRLILLMSSRSCSACQMALAVSCVPLLQRRSGVAASCSLECCVQFPWKFHSIWTLQHMG